MDEEKCNGRREKLEKHCNRWIVVSALCTFTFCFDICEFIRACRLSLSPIASNRRHHAHAHGHSFAFAFSSLCCAKVQQISTVPKSSPTPNPDPDPDIRQKTIKRMQIELKTIKLKMELCILCHSLEKGFFSLSLSPYLFYSFSLFLPLLWASLTKQLDSAKFL